MYFYIQTMHTLMLEILKCETWWWTVLGLSWVLIFEVKMVHFYCFTRGTRCREIILPQKIKILFLHWQKTDIFVTLQTWDTYFNVQFFEYSALDDFWSIKMVPGDLLYFFSCTLLCTEQNTHILTLIFKDFFYYCTEALSQKK